MRENKLKRKVMHFWNTRITQKMKKAIAIVLCVTLCVGLGGYVLSQRILYTGIRVAESYSSMGSANSRYEKFASGYLRYGRDGVAHIDNKGKEKWNQSYQMSTPIIEVTQECAVVADSGGNQIIVLGKDGIKGTIRTEFPIEKVTVSKQGIVAVLTKDKEMPRVMCYDAVGNLLVEHKPASSKTGYPIDLSLSLDGEMLLVTYIQIVDGEVSSNYKYFSFGEEAKKEKDNVVAEGTVKDIILPETYFVNHNTSVMVGDSGFMIFKGQELPQLMTNVSVESTIEKTFHSNKYIGFVLEGDEGKDSKLQIYNLSGKLVTDIDYDGKYENVDIINDEVILYEGTQCRIFKLNGIERFCGEMNMNIKGVFPALGLNSYLVIENEGIKKVQLVR